MRAGRLFPSTSVLLFVSLLLACIISSSCLKATRQAKEMQLNIPLSMDPRSLDPASAFDTASLEVIPSIYESLYQYSYLSNSHKLEPLLAADLPLFSADRLQLTIPLRKGVHFQNDPAFVADEGKGRELRAHDFIYGIKRLFLPSIQSPAASLFKGRIQGLDAFINKLETSSKNNLPIVFTEPIEGLKAIDDFTLQIKLTRPFPQITHLLAQSFTAPVARETIDLYADENWNNHYHPVGTGPFFMDRWERGKQIVLRRNLNYHADAYPVRADERFKNQGYLEDSGKTLPFADSLVFKVNRDSITANVEFEKGLLDLAPSAEGLHPEDIQGRNLNLMSDASDSIFYIAFNMQDPVLGKKKALRQAISAALDRNAFVKEFTSNTGEVADGFLPSGIVDKPSNPGGLKYTYNLEKAQQLMKEAGHKDGKGLAPLRLDLRGMDDLNRRIGQFISNSLQAIGVQVVVVLNSFPDFLEKIRDDKMQMYLGGWTLDYPDAENIYQLLYGKNHPPGSNDSRFNHPGFNAFYEKLASIPVDDESRRSVISKMETLLQEESPWAPLYYPANQVLTHAWLKNYRPDSTLRNRYKYLRVDRALKAKTVKEQSLLSSLLSSD